MSASVLRDSVEGREGRAEDHARRESTGLQASARRLRHFRPDGAGQTPGQEVDLAPEPSSLKAVPGVSQTLLGYQKVYGTMVVLL